MRICIFCGSNSGFDPQFVDEARELGRVLAANRIGLVYGGASVGLMGAVADAVLAHGGEAIGVIPEALVDKEIAHHGLSDLRVVGSMHERKALMADLSDAFVALPGGMGTLEEMFEVLTWAQLGFHSKPCAVYNIGGFFDTLLAFLDQLVATGFVKSQHRDMVRVAHSASALLDRLREDAPVVVSKWHDVPSTGGPAPRKGR
ncbi:TIGR00730 family Rossman fold protein [Acuticoccus sp. M5D2P5]|uniref:LOG family protein n=1 Tax=Acuticoccus kalidii TaxID=2910977 RepID=UPI001F24E425|nr:TIGR00730 family Rossman fold protein [Acuticoccus kalidii]MCF3935360.1 TIGR00730 family Rossman fold protein [Acuticoccus kalidii]